MYGDPDILRSRVDELREQAVDVRAMADHLVAATEGIGWSGRAADAMRLRVSDRAGHLRSAAAQHDTAAEALLDHAQEVATLLESIVAIERRVDDLVAEARTRATRGREDAQPTSEDTSDHLLLAFEPPAPGHRDWLDVEVPGL